MLLEGWALAKAGEGQGVLLTGEAGIGKSRIGQALLDALADDPQARVRLQCSPYHSDSALWPVTQQLRHAARYAADDPAEVKLDKLAALLARPRSSRAMRPHSWRTFSESKQASATPCPSCRHSSCERRP